MPHRHLMFTKLDNFWDFKFFSGSCPQLCPTHIAAYNVNKKRLFVERRSAAARGFKSISRASNLPLLRANWRLPKKKQALCPNCWCKPRRRKKTRRPWGHSYANQSKRWALCYCLCQQKVAKTRMQLHTFSARNAGCHLGHGSLCHQSTWKKIYSYHRPPTSRKIGQSAIRNDIICKFCKLV